jgi:hypothetical protein
MKKSEEKVFFCANENQIFQTKQKTDDVREKYRKKTQIRKSSYVFENNSSSSTEPNK